jgi:hypothetical protein
MAGFNNPVMIVLNLITGAIWVAAIVDIIRTPQGDWDSGGRKVLAVVVTGGLSVICFGVYLPVAPAVWFFDWRTKEKWGHHPGRSKEQAST